MKKFWKKTEGFTLVELIVVIAILGILAGIGTVGYSGYVKKANMAADQQLVSDTQQAVLLGSITDGFGSKANGLVGYIILTEDQDVAAVDTLSDASGATTTYLDSAMKASFGEGYAENLRLQYSEWTDASTMLGLVAGNQYAGSVNNSSYISLVGTDKLLNDVQKCTTELAGFVDALAGDEADAVASLNALLGGGAADSTLMKNLEAAGYTSGNNYEGLDANVLANATVFSVADNVKSDPNGIITGFASNPLTSNDAFLATDLTGLIAGDGSKSPNLIYATASWYAAGEALVNYLGDQTLINDFDAIDMSGSASDILANMNSTYTGIYTAAGSDPDLAAKVMSYYEDEVPGTGKTQAELDGEAYVGIMQSVNDLSGKYTSDAESMKSSALFQSGVVADQVNSFVAASSMSDVLGGLTDGDLLKEIANSGYEGSAVVLVVAADGNGNVECIPCPANAVP